MSDAFPLSYDLHFKRTTKIKRVDPNNPSATPTFDTKEYIVDPLTTEDLLPWLAELTTAAKAKATSLIPEKIKPADLNDARLRIETIRFTPYDLRAEISAGSGAVKVFQIVAEKIGIIDPDELKAFVNGPGVRQNIIDAFRVSTILTEQEFKEAFFPSTKVTEPFPNE